MAPSRVTPIIITTDEEAKTARATARLVKQEIKDEKTKIAKWNKIKKTKSKKRFTAQELANMILACQGEEKSI